MNPVEADQPVIQNQGWTDEIGRTYMRLPDRAEANVRKPLWDLSRNSAGLAIYFYSNAPEIKVRYTVKGGLSMPHMPATGVSGVDLYSIDADGNWNRHYGGSPGGDTIRYSFGDLCPDKYHKHGQEYRLYLPLYNTVDWLEIGVPEECEFSFIPLSEEKPIVLYGTSIAQGACASRPGMAWSTIVQRHLDYPLINLGFSGNGRLEKEMIQLLAETDARLYLLDCLPNLGNRSSDEVTQLIIDAVRQLRQSRQAPILLSDHAGQGNAAPGTKALEVVERLNKASRKAYEQLVAEGVQELYYITREEIGIPADGWVDYVHPTDLGAAVQAAAVESKIREILHLPVGPYTTQQPVSQRREPDMYEWKLRHQQVLAENRNNPPRAVILGNSIVHYWGGVADAPRRNGPESWDKQMRPAGFHNQGCGWDRIENVLWRVYHDELSGFDAEKVVLMIGTNNLDLQTDDAIAAGIRHLLSAIRRRQPKASVKLVGILPRRDKEERIELLNKQLQAIAGEEGILFSNPGQKLLLRNGKIDEGLFLDGLHPNAKGYARLVKEIAH